MNAIIQNAATRPDDAPLMVYMIYSRAPFALLTKATSPIKSFKDLAAGNSAPRRAAPRSSSCLFSPRKTASTTRASRS
jgi:hypothetical protein